MAEIKIKRIVYYTARSHPPSSLYSQFARVWVIFAKSQDCVKIYALVCLLTLSRPLGRIRPKRIHLRIPPILPRRQHVSAGLHTADTLRHDFFTYSDDHGSRQSGLCSRRERSVPGRRGHMWAYQSFPAFLKQLWA